MEEKIVRKKTVKKVVRKTTTRKAPTPVASVRASAEKESKTLLIVLGVFVVLMIASVGIGYSDKGAIDISGSISSQKDSGSAEEQDRIKNVPVQKPTTKVPNSGLVPTTDVDEATIRQQLEAAAAAASSTASSTDGTASSTEDGTEDVAAEEQGAEEVTE